MLVGVTSCIVDPEKDYFVYGVNLEMIQIALILTILMISVFLFVIVFTVPDVVKVMRASAERKLKNDKSEPLLLLTHSPLCNAKPQIERKTGTASSVD